jgi:flavin reductase (DIM6/NTAB) family NADH-FMN oxidoreductase RutF
MKRNHIKIKDLSLNIFDDLNKGWMLLASGNFGNKNYNAMTVSWGGFGTMWSKPCVIVVVKPERYTYEFMEKYDTFSLSSFPSEYKEALMICGKFSGRDNDKIKQAGLTPSLSHDINAPSFEEADLIFECKKIYSDTIKPECMLAPFIKEAYLVGGYHKFYIGEVQNLFIADSRLK